MLACMGLHKPQMTLQKLCIVQKYGVKLRASILSAELIDKRNAKRVFQTP